MTTAWSCSMQYPALSSTVCSSMLLSASHCLTLRPILLHPTHLLPCTSTLACHLVQLWRYTDRKQPGLTGRDGLCLADTATAAAAAATKHRLLGAVSQAERKATSLAKRVKLLSEAVGQSFTPPEGEQWTRMSLLTSIRG
jgi:hypothetical protein